MNLANWLILHQLSKFHLKQEGTKVSHLFKLSLRAHNIFTNVVNHFKLVTIKYLMYDKTLTVTYATTWGLKIKQYKTPQLILHALRRKKEQEKGRSGISQNLL